MTHPDTDDRLEAELAAAVARAAHLIRPGKMTLFTVWHAPDCRRPSGGPCTCTPEVVVDDPERN
jgi:hypothetical protein